MKTPLCSLIAFLAPALLQVNSARLQAAVVPPNSPSPLNLDEQPAFDFGEDPAADPLFTPELLGLTNGVAGYDQAAALAAFAQAAKQDFPPSHEVFLALWGNPRYALLPEGAAAGLLAAGSALGLASAFRGAGAEANIVSGRTAFYDYGGRTEAILGGTLYELPGVLKYVSPLVLDLDHDGRPGASRGLWQPHPARLTGPYVAFDMDGDGFADITEWIARGDGLLVTSPNPSSGRDLLGTAGGWPDGFAHLAAGFDRDGNGRVEGAELAGLYVWQDGDTNGLADAGEVAAAAGLGVHWIDTRHTNSVAGYGYLDSQGPRTGTVWDWSPNYALAHRRAAASPPPGHPLIAVDRHTDWEVWNQPWWRSQAEDTRLGRSGLVASCHLSPAALAAAGVDLATFRMGLLAAGGNVLIGCDAPLSPDGRVRARLHKLEENQCDWATILTVDLPFEELYQLACDPSGRCVLGLGDQGSKLALVDFATQTVTPPDGLDLRALGLRASGVAGGPMGPYSGGGNLWFSGWQFNEQGEVMDERVWALTPWGLWGGLSLDALRNELGPLRQHFITGPTSGFFVTPTPGGTGETLWAVDGTNRAAVAQADAFGGMHAVPGAVACVKRDGTTYSVNWWGAGQGRVLATGPEPWFYPLLTDGGGAVVAAQLHAEDRTYDYEVWTTPSGQPHLRIQGWFPGQGKVAWGAFAHYGTQGLDVAPLPDAQPAPAPARNWTYSLLPDSRLIDDCFCGRPTLLVPMRGTFELRLVAENPLFATYSVTNVQFLADRGDGTAYRVTGHGWYQVGGEVALVQSMFLTLQIGNGATNRPCSFTNDTPAVERLWPMLKVHVDETTQAPVQFYRLDLVAAPFRELWFSTVHQFTPGVQPPYTNQVSGGDLVSGAGRVVQRNRDLTRRLGLQPSPDPPDLGLDAVDILPAGEITFSIEQDVFSQTLGPLHHGDVLSARGRVVTSYAALIGAFVPQPPPTDEGLDALLVLPDGEIYFSITNDFFSQSLGQTVRRGDLLSSRGVVVKTQEELLARFQPAFPKEDAGLDALWVWPSGEVWFSTERDFYNVHFERFKRGDLFSDQGYVVCRNLELLAPFQPLEDLGDFGLDALYLVSDTTVPPGPARCVRIERAPGPNDLTLEWDAQGHVFQLEKATTVTGPYLPCRPITTEPVFTDSGALTDTTQAFYRLRQW